MLTKSKNSELFLLITTFDKKSNAMLVSNQVLLKRLAACVSLREITSNYWWEDKITTSNEFELLIKTNHGSLKKLINEIIDFHDYDEPEIIYWPVQSNESFSKWLNQNCF